MIQQNFVFYADEKKNRNLMKGVVFNDIGSLVIEQDFLEFNGQKLKIQIPDVKQISITRQQVPWVGFLIMNILVLIIFGIILRATLGALLIFIPIILLADTFGFVAAYITKWVKVEYIDKNNQMCFAFFADGSFLGWGGIFGGTEKLYQLAKSAISTIAKD